MTQAANDLTQSGSGGDAEPARGTAPRSGVAEHIRRRLTPVASRDWRSWLGTGFIVAIAAVLRFANLSLPSGLIFDEVYYANEGAQLLDHGVEWRTETDSAGRVLGSSVDFVVHPPLGKWLISIGVWLHRHHPAWLTPFDTEEFGWRFMPALIGVASVLITIRVARRMFHSNLLGYAAGLLMALDGFQLVLSRTAILDIFVLFFAIAAFAMLLLDRDWHRRRWLLALESGLDPTAPGKAGRPKRGWGWVPWWRLGAGIMLGAGCAVKWSLIFLVPVFIGLIFFWEAGLRKTAGAPHPWRDAILDEAGWVLAMLALIPAVYLASWTGWFLGDTGWKRHYLRDQGLAEPAIWGPIYNLYQYHMEMLNFHNGLVTPHPYQSWPWQWLILGRPVAFYWSSNPPPCGANECAAEILLLGTPLLWWSFIPALGATLWFWISRRDWRAAAILLPVAATILPWFNWELSNRTMFYFYASPTEPFLILAVVYVLGMLINPPAWGGRDQFRAPFVKRRRLGIYLAGAYLAAVTLCFWWYYPIFVGNSIPKDLWNWHMLLGNHWI